MLWYAKHSIAKSQVKYTGNWNLSKKLSIKLENYTFDEKNTVGKWTVLKNNGTCRIRHFFHLITNNHNIIDFSCSDVLTQ